MFGVKQTEAGFTLGFCLCLAPSRFLLSWKNSSVIADVKHTHTMMQPPPRLKIRGQLLSDAFKPKSVFFSIITLVPCRIQNSVLEFFLCIFVLFSLSFKSLLWSHYNVVDPFSVFSQPLNSVSVLMASW